MPNLWPPPKDEIEAHVRAGKTATQIGALYGRNRDAVTRLMSKLGIDREALKPVPSPPEPDPAPVDPVLERQELLERTRALRLEASALKEVAGEKSLRATLEKIIRDVVPAYDPPPAYDRRGIVPSQNASEETIILKFSDWHAYELVTLARTRGLNAYTASIMGARVKRVVDSAIKIKQRMERGGGWRLPRLVIGANGDFISGTIHELERHSDAPSVVHAAYGCANVLASAIRDLSAHFPEVEVFCTAGNHGRMPDARRMQQKDPGRNWDTVIYYFAYEMLRNCPNVRFHIPDSYSVGFEVEGWNFLQTHGHDVKSWNSIPWYGLNRLVSNINALEASRGVTIHHYLFGHFHEASSLPHAAGESFINGSLIGGNEFSMNALGKMGKPCQWMLGVHKEHGVTFRFPLSAASVTEESPRYDVEPWRATA